MITHSYTTQGKRPYQEDRYIIKSYLKKNINTSASETESFTRYPMDFIAVFDGHGGDNISDTLSKSLPSYFYKQNIVSNNVPKPHPKYNKYIIDTFNQIQTQLNATHNKSSLQGSTVCICLIYMYKDKKLN
jgi:serine/threonine protein phosphatase PrpC